MGSAEWVVTLVFGDTPCGPRRMALPDDSWKLGVEIMTARDQTRMTDQERAEEKVRAIIEELDRRGARPTDPRAALQDAP